MQSRIYILAFLWKVKSNIEERVTFDYSIQKKKITFNLFSKIMAITANSYVNVFVSNLHVCKKMNSFWESEQTVCMKNQFT